MISVENLNDFSIYTHHAPYNNPKVQLNLLRSNSQNKQNTSRMAKTMSLASYIILGSIGGTFLTDDLILRHETTTNDKGLQNTKKMLNTDESSFDTNLVKIITSEYTNYINGYSGAVTMLPTSSKEGTFMENHDRIRDSIIEDNFLGNINYIGDLEKRTRSSEESVPNEVKFKSFNTEKISASVNFIGNLPKRPRM